jgi:hypothetical protein
MGVRVFAEELRRGGMRRDIARSAPKQRSHGDEFVLTDMIQCGLMDWMLELGAILKSVAVA